MKSVGILWTGIEKVVVYGINFVQGVILARLLCPEDFGLTVMLGISLGLGGTLAESGLGTALVIGVKGRGDGVRRLERQVLGWNVGTAVGIYVVLSLRLHAWARHVLAGLDLWGLQRLAHWYHFTYKPRRVK